MNLRDSLRIIRKRWLLVAVILVVCVGGGVTLNIVTTREYEASAQIFVSTTDLGNTADGNALSLAQGNTFTEARVQSYTAVASSPAVTSAVIRDLGLDLTSNQLRERITADAPVNTVLINLHVTDQSAERAATIANAVAAQFSTYVSSIEQSSSEAQSPVKLTVTQPAETPTSPIAPKSSLNLGLAILIGLVLGVAAAILREILDNTVKTAEELTNSSHTPVLGVVPWDKRVSGAVISFRADTHGMRSEAFRQLRTNLQFVDVDNPPRIIAVTSALPGEGKSHTALNLAAALAEAGERVCLVEADLRRPTVARVLGLVGDVGLTSVLIREVPVEEVLQNAGHNLAVMTSGPVPPNPSELLASDRCRLALQYIAEKVDVVVVDTAPLLPVADGAEVSALADATLLTVRAGKTTRDQIRRAVETLANVGVRPVGAILSMASTKRSGDGYYYSNYRPDRPSHSAERVSTRSDMLDVSSPSAGAE